MNSEKHESNPQADPGAAVVESPVPKDQQGIAARPKDRSRRYLLGSGLGAAVAGIIALLFPRRKAQAGHALVPIIQAPFIQTNHDNSAAGTTILDVRHRGDFTALDILARGSAVRGFSRNNPGLVGQAGRDPAPAVPAEKIGVFGFGDAVGVEGRSDSGTGIHGRSDSTSNPGVQGVNSTSGDGVQGTSTAGAGVFGRSTRGHGVVGSSDEGFGVLGTSTSAVGVEGTSENASGVRGISSRDSGVHGRSISGVGVEGRSNNSVGVVGTAAGALRPPPNARFGVFGSGERTGVSGESVDGAGVVGGSNTGIGVAGASTSGDGVRGHSASGPVGVRGSAAAGIGVSGSSSAPNKPGVQGVNTAGDPLPTLAERIGVFGFGDNAGVLGRSGSGPGVWGRSEATTKAGVQGTNTADDPPPPPGLRTGVYGFGDGTGVLGRSDTGEAGRFEIVRRDNASIAFIAATGGLGGAGDVSITNPDNSRPALRVSTNGSGTTLIANNTGNGVAGQFSISSSDNGQNVISARTEGSGRAGQFVVANSQNINPALEARTNGAGWAGNFVGVGSSSRGVQITTPAGQSALAVVGGSKSAVVATSQGARALYTEEASEVWFSDYGFGRVQNGRVVIEVDRLFAETVNLGEPYHAFLQAYGAAELYVSERTATAFEVRGREGDPDVEFSYRLVAKRRGYEKTRLGHAPWADSDPNLYPEKRAESEAQHRLLTPGR